MRAVIQRVSAASVAVDEEVLAEIGQGLVVLLAVGTSDKPQDASWMAGKITELRIFERDGRFDLSLLDVGGEVLLVSQFTLYGDARKGRRPSFTDAAGPGIARRLYELTAAELEKRVPVKLGRFQERMKVTIVNEGPVTILLDSEKTL